MAVNAEVAADLGLASSAPLPSGIATVRPVPERDARYLAGSGRIRSEFRRSGTPTPEGWARSRPLYAPPAGGGTSLGQGAPLGSAGTARRTPLLERHLNLADLRSGDRLTLTYWRDGRYDYAALGRINHFLRDWRRNVVATIDTRVLDILAQIQHAAGNGRPLAILSGYRTPQTNAMLARVNSGVAHNSLHMRGMAIDLTLDGVAIESVGDFARSLGLGGVGIYPSQRFIHVDCGPVRTWRA